MSPCSIFRSAHTSCGKMPFVAMCGFPSSGKSTRAKELESYLCKEKGVNTRIIADYDFGLDKNVIYADSIKEKELRGNLKSSVQRTLTKEDVVILDSLNYIKGCRYELYCVTKSCQTPQCVVYCGTSAEQAKEWNQGRKDDNRYSEDIFDALVMRFEAPDSRNRWDQQLFVLQSDDPLPCQQIYEALFHSKAPPPNLSTLSQPISSTNFLHELDQITQRTVSLIMDAQKTCVPGDSLAVPGAKDKVELGRPLTLAELQRMRRQFISYTKTHPVDDTTKLTNIFVQFLNNSFR